MPSSFRVDAPFKPAGDQPQAIEQLVEGCSDYRRALDVVDRLGQRHHHMAVAIDEWVSANCPSSDL